MTDRAPRPRTTRRGEIVVGPTIGARYGPGALLGLPIVSLVLTPLGAAGVQEALIGRARAGSDGARALLTGPAPYLVAFAALWGLLALWALVPLVLAHTVVLLDPERGTVSRRRGLGRRRSSRPVTDVVWAVGEADRQAIGLIGLLAGGQAAARAAAEPPGGAEPEVEQWRVPHVGWDAASFDGLRALQERAGLEAAPPRWVLLQRAHRARQLQAHRELADRVGMAWLPAYDDDPARFQRDFDHARRVLGGKEPVDPGARTRPPRGR